MSIGALMMATWRRFYDGHITKDSLMLLYKCGLTVLLTMFFVALFEMFSPVLVKLF